MSIRYKSKMREIAKIEEHQNHIELEYKFLIILESFVDDLMELSDRTFYKLREIIYDKSEKAIITFKLFLLISGLIKGVVKSIKKITILFKSKKSIYIIYTKLRTILVVQKIKKIFIEFEFDLISLLRQTFKNNYQDLSQQGSEKVLKSIDKGESAGTWTELSGKEVLIEWHNREVNKMEHYISNIAKNPESYSVYFSLLLHLAISILSIVDPGYWIENVTTIGRDASINMLDCNRDKLARWKRDLHRSIKKRKSDLLDQISIFERDRRDLVRAR